MSILLSKLHNSFLLLIHDIVSPVHKTQTPVSSCRYDNSLGKFEFSDNVYFTFLVASFLVICTCSSGLLTKKFIHLIKEAEDGVLDLNKAADMLGVSFMAIIQMMSIVI